MEKVYRIAFGRFMQETNSFSTVLTTLDDFKRTHYVEGHNLINMCMPQNTEVEGFLKNLELSGFVKAFLDEKKIRIEIVPLLSAWSISGGPVDKNTFQYIQDKLKEMLINSGKLDGVFFSLHGALGVEGKEDPEAELLSMIKNIVGKEIPVAVTMDLHGNLTRGKLENIDILCAYKTNPHRDMYKTGYRAGKLLIDTIAGKINPTTTWRALPMIMGGGNTIDLLPPMNSIFNRMKQIEEDPRVLTCSLFMCHPFLDNPDLGWSVYVSTNNNKYLAEQIADELAEKCWNVKDKKPPEFISVEKMLEEVRKAKLTRKLGCVAVCDASDVVGAGGTGENTAILSFLLEEGKDLISYVPIRDPDTIFEIWEKSEGEDVEIIVGGKLQPKINEPVIIEGKLLTKKENPYFGKMVVIDVGHIKLVITEGYAMPMKPAFYEDVNLNVSKADIVIVKNFFHFRIYFLLKSLKSLYVKTQGITDLDRCLNIKTNYPVYPKDQIDDWKTIDKKKRGINENSENIQVTSDYKLQRNRKKQAIKASLALGAISIGLLVVKKVFVGKKKK